MYKDRIERLKRAMASESIEAIFVSCPQNRYYLSGFRAEDVSFNESAGYLLIPLSGQPFLLTDFRYQEAAKEEAPLFNVITYSQEDVSKSVISLCRDLGVKNLAIESQFLNVFMFKSLEKVIRKEGGSIELVPTQGIIEKIRAIKSEEEIEKIKKSLGLIESVMEEVFDFLKPGMTEKDLAWFVEKRAREGGAKSLSFPPIVASGSRASLPHGEPSEKVIQREEPIVIDIGARLDFYCSDITRTVFIGKVSDRWLKVYEIVKSAQEKARAYARPGISSSELDSVARTYIEDAGYGEYFGHGLGHGVGLAIHELPGIRKLNPVTLEENMVFTIEPGIYLPGEGGVRIENMVVLKKEGAEVLNNISTELLVIER